MIDAISPSLHAPDSWNLLRIWDECYAAHPIRRSLALLAEATPKGGIDWGMAPVGRRDDALLQLYETLFGTQLEVVTHCPQCNERLEMTFNADDIRAPLPEGAAPATPTMRHKGWNITYRLPNSDDLLHVLSYCGDIEQAQQALLGRCLLNVRRGRKSAESTQLPLEVVHALLEGMSRQDPNADIRMRMTCAACRHTWDIAFDIVSFIWNALEDWAQRTLADVHLLARAYGWNEQEILNLSATRRQYYVEMVMA